MTMTVLTWLGEVISCFYFLFHFDTNKLLPSSGQILTTIVTFSTSTHHHHRPLSFLKYDSTMDNSSPTFTGFFFFFFPFNSTTAQLCLPPLLGFYCFDNGTSPPLGNYFILFSIFFSWYNLFKLMTTRKWQGDNIDRTRREIEGSTGCFWLFDILLNSQALLARSSMPTCVSIPISYEVWAGTDKK